MHFNSLLVKRLDNKKVLLIVTPLITYSVRNATTGSFFEAILAGTKPEIEVNKILIIIMVIATLTGKVAIV